MTHAAPGTMVPAMPTTPKKFKGTWRIVETRMWDQEALDLVGPANISFDSNGLGSLAFIAITACIDCRFDGDEVEFSWMGDDEGDPICGRGRAEITDEGTMTGDLFIHQGDESWFLAQRE